MNAPALQQIGLTESESKVYLALLQLGDATRGDIVNTSQIAGSKVYEVLQRLQDKGLASVYSKDKVKHFRATHPQQIMRYLEDKKAAISKTEVQVGALLPQLLSLYGSSKEEQEVELLSGLKGLEIIFREQVELLKRNDSCYVIGGTRGSDEESIVAFFEKIHLLRNEKGIKTRMLFNQRQKDSTENYYPTQKYPGTETRYISHTSPVAINIYADRTVIIIFGKKVSAIHIKSAEVASSFLEYFNLLWASAK